MARITYPRTESVLKRTGSVLGGILGVFMTKDEVLIAKHAIMTLESALGMLSNSNIPNSELMPILNMFSSVQEDLVKLYADLVTSLTIVSWLSIV